MSNYRYFIVFVAFLAMFAARAQAQDMPAAPPVMAAPADPQEALTVKDLLIEKTATDAVAARKDAIAEAQRQALLKLAGFPAEGKTPPALPDDLTISTLVRDFSVRNEQISVNRYAAQFTVRFNPNAVDFIKGWASVDITPPAPAADAAAPAAEVQTDANADANTPTQLTAQAAVAQSEKLSIDVTMAITGFQEWVEAQKRLQSLTPAPAVDLTGISNSSARFHLTADWPGGLEAFRTALAAQHLTLDQAGAVYTLRMN